MSKKFGMFLVVTFAVNLAINIFTMNIAGICGWLCAFIAQSQLTFGDN